MREIQIPTTSNPFVVWVNGVRYIYEAGATVTVPDEVAEVIEQAQYGPNLPPFDCGPGDSASGGGSGGGADVLNDSGIIKQEHLPDGYPYQIREEELAYTITASLYNYISGAWVPAKCQADKNFVLVEGESFVFNFNGTDTEVTIKKVVGGQYLGFGNESIQSAQLPDTGESFFIASPDKIGSGSATANVMVMIKNGISRPTTMTLTRVTKETFKLDPMYLPEIPVDRLPDGYPYDTREDKVLYSFSGFNLSDMGGGWYRSGMVKTETNFDLIEGETYIVKYGDVVVEAVAKFGPKAEVGGSRDCMYLGNPIALTSAHGKTDDEFLIQSYAISGQSTYLKSGYVWFKDNTITEVSICQIQGEIKKLDPKYLPTSASDYIIRVPAEEVVELDDGSLEIALSESADNFAPILEAGGNVWLDISEYADRITDGMLPIMKCLITGWTLMVVNEALHVMLWTTFATTAVLCTIRCVAAANTWEPTIED